jgi:biotin carboxylase
VSREYLIQDPYHAYAARFIEHFHRKYGYRAICFYTDRRERLRHEPHFPVLRSECVAASYDIGTSGLARFAAHVAAHHDVVAALPFNEPAVLPAAELARHLGLSWAQPEVMRRFQDKFALKEHLRRVNPEIPMNASQRVETVADVQAARRHPAYQRFVLKPNEGFGNRSIGMFDAATPEAEIDDFLRRLPGARVLMEQYIDGPEYFVNGQVDGEREVTVVAIFQYVRVPANGRRNIDSETLLVPHRDPRFAQLARYTQQVVQAAGLRRSPFHLELKIGETGPCLIEVGARLAGHSNASPGTIIWSHRITAHCPWTGIPMTPAQSATCMV